MLIQLNTVSAISYPLLPFRVFCLDNRARIDFEFSDYLIVHSDANLRIEFIFNLIA